MVGQDLVERPARLHEDSDRGSPLVVGAGGDDLPHGVHHPPQLGLEAGEVDTGLALAPAVVALRERRPESGHLRLVVREEVAAGIGESQGTSAALVVALHQALVLELGERRVDRSGARPPGSSGPVRDLLDHLVPVERTVRQHGQDRDPDVPPAGTRSASGLVLSQTEQPGQPRRRSGAAVGWPPLPAAPLPAPLAATAACTAWTATWTATWTAVAAPVLEHLLELASPVTSHPAAPSRSSLVAIVRRSIDDRSRYIATVRSARVLDKRLSRPPGPGTGPDYPVLRIPAAMPLIVSSSARSRSGSSSPRR